jgi:hypothetical protein
VATVTQRIKQIKQPRGGYINPKEFNTICLNDGINLNEEENIHSILVGIAVDYLTRYMTGTPKEEAFKISIKGAAKVEEFIYAFELLDEISGLDDKSISNACKLVGYDVCYRSGIMGYKPVQGIVPNDATISNIRTMVNRSIKFFNEHGPITNDGFTFLGAYTNLITSGDGDFLTEDTLWDFKVSINPPRNEHTLQLLVYYIMGIHSINKEFENIKKLGIFNPRLNKIFLLEINKISQEIIEKVSLEVIGYQN